MNKLSGFIEAALIVTAVFLGIRLYLAPRTEENTVGNFPVNQIHIKGSDSTEKTAANEAEPQLPKIPVSRMVRIFYAPLPEKADAPARIEAVPEIHLPKIHYAGRLKLDGEETVWLFRIDGRSGLVRLRAGERHGDLALSSVANDSGALVFRFTMNGQSFEIRDSR